MRRSQRARKALSSSECVRTRIMGGAEEVSISMEKMEKHCSNNWGCYSCLGGSGLITFIVILSISWKSLHPTEVGLLKDGITGVTDLSNVYKNGRYFVGPTKDFLRFPINRVSLSFGNTSMGANRDLIPARTGPGEHDTESGGQPMTLSIAFQYQLERNKIAKIYETFGIAWESSYLRFAQQAVTDAAQKFTPSSFWAKRVEVERAIWRSVNDSLFEQGFAQCKLLQLRRVVFKPSYEQTITNIQMQEQLRVTKQYQQQVTAVEKQVDLMHAETTATVTRINAEAERASSIITNQAEADALEAEQAIKGQMYAQLVSHLGWSPVQFLQYVKMKALNAQPGNKVTVGVSPLG